MTSTLRPSRAAAAPRSRVQSGSGVVARALWWGAAIVGIGLVAGAVWLVTNSRLFDLRSLSIQGNVRLRDAEVAALARLTTGTNVLWTSTGSVERRIESSPWVVDAVVKRTLPATITISVRERTPVAVTAGEAFLVAADGMVLGPARNAATLPLIRVPGGELGPGKSISGVVALRVARALPEELRGSVARVLIGVDGQVKLELRTGVRVLYGDTSSLEAKGAALDAVLSWAQVSGVQPRVVDVRVPRAPVLRP